MNYAWDANCDGIEITEEDVDYLMKAIDLALHRIKQKNKEKYTLKNTNNKQSIATPYSCGYLKE